jgi:hypothetical protein
MRSFSFTDFIKRALPFFAALVIGVFIASFFVDLSKPRFGRGARKHHEMKRLRIENEELKNENLRLRNQLENHEFEDKNIRPVIREERIIRLGDTEVEVEETSPPVKKRKLQ